MTYQKRMLALLTCIVLLASICSAGCTDAKTVSDQNMTPEIKFTDASGKEIVLPATAERIAVQNFYAAEILIALGAGDKIVAISETLNKSAYKPMFSGREINYGDWTSPDMEKLTAAKPEILICHDSSHPKNAEQIEAANITIVYMDCKTLDHIASDIRTLGQISGETETAEELAQFQENYLGLVKERTSKLTDAQRPSVYYESTTPYNANGKNTSGDNLIYLAGGKNVAGSEFEGNKKVSAEWVIARNPDVIIRHGVSNTTTRKEHLNIQSEVKNRTGFSSLDAVKNDKVYTVGAVVMTGPRTVVGLLYVAKALHPDIFADIDPTAVHKEYASRYMPGSADGLYFYPGIS